MPEIEPYRIIELDDAWAEADETLGSKKKGWFLSPDNNERLLFKFARVNRGIPTGEAWAEKIAAEIAALMQIPCAKVELAVLNGQQGSIGLRFPELANREVELIHGVDLLSAHVIGYDRERDVWKQSDHNLANIIKAVSNVLPEGPELENGLRIMAGFLVLDALILNMDRHHENWAFFRERRQNDAFYYRVAPSFDHASSLGRELTEEKLAAWGHDQSHLERYVYKGRGGIYVDGSASRPENPLRLVELAIGKCPAYFVNWLEQLRIIDNTHFANVISRVPDTLMSQRAKRFCASILDFTRSKLLSFL